MRHAVPCSYKYIQVEHQKLKTAYIEARTVYRLEVLLLSGTNTEAFSGSCM